MKIKQTFIISVILSLVMMVAFDLVACSKQDENKYSLQINGDNVLAYQSDFDFDEYFENSYVVKTTPEGEEYYFPITISMLSAQIDTSSVGEKSVDIKYNSKTLTFNYVVKYKVEFLVDLEVFDTQLVLDSAELEPKTPSKEGYTFEGWQDLPQTITNNVQVNAVFSEDVVVPELLTLNAEYGDTLEDLTLPSNKFGAWQFEDELSSSVGDIGNQIKNVKFVQTNGEVFTTSTVNILISKKTLQFKFDSLEFEYDATEKQPTFYFNGVDKEQVNVIYVPYQDTAVNVGEYEFEYLIDDDNYQGQYSGSFLITKKQVKVLVGNLEMTYLQTVPAGSFLITDIYGNPLGTNLVDEIGVELDLPMLSPVVGEYQIDIKEKTYINFDVSVTKGLLRVDKARHVVNAVPNAEQVVYGNTLSQVELSSSISGIGSWAWVDSSVVISQMNGVSAMAKFTPNDQDNYEGFEQEVSLEVLKRAVEIKVVKNQFTYNAKEQSLIYVVDGIFSGDEQEYIVIGNSAKINADTYNLVLTLQSDKYKAQEVNAQLIIEKANMADFKSVQDEIGVITYDKNVASRLSHVDLPSGYAWKDNSLELLIGKNSYEVVFVPDDQQNYNVEQSSIVIELEKAQSIIDVNQCEFTYNQNHEYELELILNHKETQVTFDMYYKGQKVERLKDAGEYSLEISCSESEHYKSASKTIIVQILAVENKDELPEIINAIYLDSLSKYQLPTNSTGVWAWEEGLDAKVGNAGKQVHKAVFTPADAINYKAREVEIEFSVAKKAVIEPTLSVSSYVYTSTTIKPNVNGTAEYFVKENVGGKNVGNYSIVLELTDKDNYAWASSNGETITLDYAITKANNAWNREPTLTKSSWTYGDTNVAVSYQVQFGTEEIVINYVGVGNDYNSNQMPTNVGNYKAIFVINECDNYTGLSHTFEFNIVKKAINPPSIQPKEYTGQTLIADVESNDLYLVIQNEGGVYVGEYQVKLMLRDSDNYCWSNSESQEITMSFTIIANDENIWTELPSLDKTTWVFGENCASVNQGKSKFGNPTFYVDGIDNDYHDDEMPENAGKYRAIFIVDENENYSGLTYIIEFSIEKQIVEMPQIILSATYTGEEIIFATTGTHYTAKDATAEDVGDYIVVLTLNDSGNYKWSDSEDATAKFNVKITKADNEWNNQPSLDKVSWIYGEDSAIINDYDSKFGDVCAYVQGVDNDYNGLEMPTNPGKYKAVFVVESTTNYTGLIWEIEFNIDKISVTLPQIPSSKVYTGELLVADMVESDLYSIENNGGIDAGNYLVVLTLNDSAKYKWADGKEGDTRTLVFTISKLSNQWLGEISEIDDSKIINYGESIDLQAKYGNVEVKAIGIDGTEYNSQIMPNQAGSYQITLTVNESTNYQGLTKTFTLKIAPIQLIIEKAPIYNDTLFYENLVDASNVSNMQSTPLLNIQIAGSFKYQIKLGQIIENGKVKVTVSFAPNDNRNYIAPLDVYAFINVKEVAYIGTNYYGSIESALEVSKSGDVVWVKAGEMNAVIASDCLIPTGVTLNIPHTENSMNAVESDGKVLATIYKDAKIQANVLTTITINKGVKLTNNGTIQIAGELSGGWGGRPYAGHTTGKVAKLVLQEGAIINSVGGTIRLFGLILEEQTNNGSQVVIDGGSLALPFVVRDYRGGTYMYNIYTKAAAFNEFELRNITAFVTIKNSANVYGYANIYSGDQQNGTVVTLVSQTSNAVIHFANKDSYMTFKYNILGGYDGDDSWADGIMDVKIYGGATADPMTLHISTSVFGIKIDKEISTEKMFFPITWRFNVSLFDGNYTMAYKYKLMPGAVFIVGEGATVEIHSLAVYTQAEFDKVVTPSDVLETKYVNKTNFVYNEELIVDALCVVKSGGSLIIGVNGGNVGGDIAVEDGGQFECIVTDEHWTCNKCGANIYQEDKPSKCPNSSLFNWHTEFTKVLNNKSVTSKEGTEDRNGTTCDIVLVLSVNGEIV